MTPTEFKAALVAIDDRGDTPPDVEERHSKADDLMCQVLRDLGYADGVEVFAKWEKWYA